MSRKWHCGQTCLMATRPTPLPAACRSPGSSACSTARHVQPPQHLSPIPVTSSTVYPQQPVTWAFGGRQAWGPLPEQWGLPAGSHPPPGMGLGCCSVSAGLRCTLSWAAGCAGLLDSAHSSVVHARPDNAAVLHRMLEHGGVGSSWVVSVLQHCLGTRLKERRVL